MKRIRIPILNTEYAVYLIMGQSKEIKKFIHNHFEDKTMFIDMERNRGITYYRDGYMPVICMNKLSLHDFVGTLAHEAVHAIDFIFQSIGESTTRGELFAHSVGAIVRNGTKFYIKNSTTGEKGEV